MKLNNVFFALITAYTFVACSSETTSDEQTNGNPIAKGETSTLVIRVNAGSNPATALTQHSEKLIKTGKYLVYNLKAYSSTSIKDCKNKLSIESRKIAYGAFSGKENDQSCANSIATLYTFANNNQKKTTKLVIKDDILKSGDTYVWPVEVNIHTQHLLET